MKRSLALAFALLAGLTYGPRRRTGFGGPRSSGLARPRLQSADHHARGLRERMETMGSATKAGARRLRADVP